MNAVFYFFKPYFSELANKKEKKVENRCFESRLWLLVLKKVENKSKKVEKKLEKK